MPKDWFNIPRAVALAAATLAALGMAACAVGPDYRTPDSEMPTQYQHAADVAAINDAREPVALDTWWAGFQDPVLTKIVERALEQNLDMAASIARVAQARAAANFAGAELLPQGNAYGDVTKLHQSVQSPLGKIGSAFPGYDRNQTLYSVGAAARGKSTSLAAAARCRGGQRRTAGGRGEPHGRSDSRGSGGGGRLLPCAGCAGPHRHRAAGRDQPATA
jgi:outer membrane protein TolC